MYAVIRGYVSLPAKVFSVSSIEKDTTVKVYPIDGGKPKSIHQYEEQDGYINVPRDYGIRLAQQEGVSLVDRTSSGFDAFSGIDRIKLREYQKPWVSEVFDKLHSGAYDVFGKAYTGSGKTVMSLEVARRLKRTTLVIVDQEFLRDQWIDSASRILGVPKDRIGLIQGKICDYEGKDIVIGMIQTLYNKEFAKHIYDYFGFVILDEAHTVGAEKFSRVLWKFPARYRLAVSATPERNDPLQKILNLHLGEVSVELNKKHRKSIVRYVEYYGVPSWYANISPKNGRYIQELSEDQARNFLIARIVKNLYDRGRNILVVSDRIQHLEVLMLICRSFGIPVEDMGQATRYRNRWTFAKDKSPKTKPKNIAPGGEFVPVKLQLISKKIPQPQVDEAKTKRIVFATYSMFQKGVDVPSLDAGIDATPRSKATQVHGRILRQREGKKVPIWVTIRDVFSYKAEFQFQKRLRDYVESNAEIYEWRLEKGVKKVPVQKLLKEVSFRIDMLKRAKNITGLDGNNTIMIQNIESVFGIEAGNGTGKIRKPKKPKRRTRKKR